MHLGWGVSASTIDGAGPYYKRIYMSYITDTRRALSYYRANVTESVVRYKVVSPEDDGTSYYPTIDKRLLALGDPLLMYWWDLYAHRIR